MMALHDYTHLSLQQTRYMSDFVMKQQVYNHSCKETCSITKLNAGRPHTRNYSSHRQTPWTDDSSLLFATRAVTDGQTDATKYIISQLCGQ